MLLYWILLKPQMIKYIISIVDASIEERSEIMGTGNIMEINSEISTFLVNNSGIQRYGFLLLKLLLHYGTK